MESKFTQVYKLATAQNPLIHLLCAKQLWDSPWGYGLSLYGCNDGMPFKVGKPQLVFFGISLVVYIIFIMKNNAKVVEKLLIGFFLFVGLFSLFLTTYLSTPLWILFKNQLALIQFPWRFISISLIGIGFMGSWLINQITEKWKKNIMITLCFFILVISIAYYQSRTFINDQLTTSSLSYEDQYINKEAISTNASYGYAELTPASVNEAYYLSFVPFIFPRKLPLFFNVQHAQPVQNGLQSGKVTIMKDEPFYRSVTLVALEKKVFVNIHAYPNWVIKVNNKIINSYDLYLHKKVDLMGRPILDVNPGQTYTVITYYEQTSIEKYASIISGITFLFCLMMVIINKKKYIIKTIPDKI